jgi:ParB family transcriptional regulator, chromosome partitioning protein
MASTTPSVALLPVAAIAPSKTNPRKTFDAEFLKELVASVKQHGVLQPILVRPLAKKNGVTHELVAGEQRWRAAKDAGLKEIPTIVRTLSDNEAAELQIVENLQRKDVHPLEEGTGYQMLLDLRDEQKQTLYDVPKLAARVNKSTSYIYQRLQLAKLQPAGQDLLLKDVLSTEHGILLARLSDDDQKQALKDTVRKWDGPRSARQSLGAGDYEVHSVRQLRQYIQEILYRSLDKAPFPKDDGTLHPKAPGPQGKCIGCQYNTASTPGLYSDLSGQCCAFAPCYETKMTAHLTRKQRELAKQTGGEVVAITRDSKYALNPAKREKLTGVLTAEQFEETKANTKGAKKALVVDGRGRGETTYIVPARAVEPAQPSRAERLERLQERHAELEGRVRNDVARTLIVRIAKKVKPQPKAQTDRELLLDLLAWGIERSYQTDEIVKLLDRAQPHVGWVRKPKGEEATGRVFKESTKAYRERLAKLNVTQLAQVIAVVAGVNVLWSGAGEATVPPALGAAAGRYRVDPKAVVREVRDTFKPQFQKLAAARTAAPPKPPKPAALKLGPGEIPIRLVLGAGREQKVAGRRAGDHFGIHKALQGDGYNVTHLLTGRHLAGPYEAEATAVFVAERLAATGGTAWNFDTVEGMKRLPADALELGKTYQRDPARAATDAAAAAEAKKTKPNGKATIGKAPDKNGKAAAPLAVVPPKPAPAAAVARKAVAAKRSRAVQTSARAAR